MLLHIFEDIGSKGTCCDFPLVRPKSVNGIWCNSLGLEAAYTIFISLLKNYQIPRIARTYHKIPLLLYIHTIRFQ